MKSPGGRPTTSGSTRCPRRSPTSAPSPAGRAYRHAGHARTWASALATPRHDTPERVFRAAREHPQDLNWTPGPGPVAAAAAVAAAGLQWRLSCGRSPDVAALVIPGSGPELAR